MSVSTIKLFPNSPSKTTSFFTVKKNYSFDLNESASTRTAEIQIDCTNGILAELTVSKACSLEIFSENRKILGETFTVDSLTKTLFVVFYSEPKTLIFEIEAGEEITINFDILEFNDDINKNIPAEKISLNSQNFSKRLASLTNLSQAISVLDNLSTLSVESLEISGDLTIGGLSARILYFFPEQSSNIFIQEDWAGIIFNASPNNTSQLLIKSLSSSDLICELSYNSNLRAAFIFYDSVNEEFVVVEILNYKNSYQPQQITASQIQLDTTNFDKNLSTSDYTVQKALEKLDEAITGVASLNFQSYSSTLSEDKELQKQDPYFQLLNPGLSSKSIILSTEWIGQIINDSNGTFPLYLKHPITNQTLAELSLNSELKGVLVWYDTSLADFIIQQTSLWQKNMATNISSQTTLTNTQISIMKFVVGKRIKL